jgi:multiple sugar transport system permease protein
MTNRMAPPAAFLLPLFLLFSIVFRYDDVSLFDTKLGLILALLCFQSAFCYMATERYN